MKIAWKQVVAALLVGCILGVAGGAVLSRVAFRRMHRSAPDPERMVKKLTFELGLDAQQQAGIRKIMESRRDSFKAMHKAANAKFQELRTAMDADIERLLKPEQQQKFRELQARWEARHKDMPKYLPEPR
ncbi:MAG: periplasmic heavy metal sensor [Elusimicrobiota bacterium]|jgi:Spy/CpxP family protein refolding chaperone